VHDERSPLPQRRMWPDLVVEREAAHDLAVVDCFVVDLARAKVLGHP